MEIQRKPRPKKGDLVREKIIKKAIVEFSRNGYDKGSLTHIGEKAGVSKANILYHFKSKLNLFEKAVFFAWGRFHQSVEQTYDPNDNGHERLLKYLRGFITWKTIYRKEAELVLLFSYYCSVHKDMGRLYADLLMEEFNQVKSFLYSGVRQKLFKLDFDIDTTARLLVDSVFGVFINSLGGKFLIISNQQYDEMLKIFIQKYTNYNEGKLYE